MKALGSVTLTFVNLVYKELTKAEDTYAEIKLVLRNNL